MKTALASIVALQLLTAAAPAGGDAPYTARTTVKLNRGFWELAGARTYKGADAEGLLLLVRMVNATFEDRNPATCPKGFDPDRNTEAFLAKLPEYAAHGVRAFSLNLQGGNPGYKGALCSAFEADGSLRKDFLARVARVIEACDQQGIAILLGLFDEDQDQVLKDDAAVKKGVENVVRWLKERGYKNVILEIANEFPSAGYQHKSIQTTAGMEELIGLARGLDPDLLVSASGGKNGRLHAEVQTAASFILLHFGGIEVDLIQERVASSRKISKAIVCSDDPRTGESGAAAAQAASDAMCSWGYSNKSKNETYPFKFEGAADDPIVYAKLKALATKR